MKIEHKKAAFHALLAFFGVLEMASTDPDENPVSEFRFTVSGAWAGFHAAATVLHLMRSRRAH